MDTPARTIERLFTLAAVGSAFGAGFLLLEASTCNDTVEWSSDNLDVAAACLEPVSINIGRALLGLAAILGILVTQAWLRAHQIKEHGFPEFFDDRTETEMRLDAEDASDDVEDMGEGWAKLEERMLASRVEEE